MKHERKTHNHLKDGPNFLALESVLGGSAKRRLPKDEYDRFMVEGFEEGERHPRHKENAVTVQEGSERLRAKHNFRRIFGG